MSVDNDSSIRCFLCDSVVSGVIIQVYTDHLKTQHKVLINFKWIIDKSLGENSCAADTVDVIDVDLEDSKNEDSPIDAIDVESMNSEDGFDSLFDSLEDTSDDENSENDCKSGDPVRPVTNETAICIPCNRVFTRSQYLKVHLKRGTCGKDKVESFFCDVCGKSLASKHSFDKHLITHTKEERKHSCETCGAEYSTIAALKVHMKTTHTTKENKRKSLCKNNSQIQTKHTCEICERVCSTAEVLKEHYSIAHPIPDYEDILTSDIKERQHSCKICNKNSPTEAALKEHINTVHPDDQTIQLKQACDICEELKQNATADTLRTHMKTHTGGESLNCDQCGKVFAQETSLKWHKKVCIGGKTDSAKNGPKEEKIVGIDIDISKYDEKEENSVSNDTSEMLESAEEWIRSKSALNHMANIMTGEFRSKRHKLFLDKKQRELGGGLKPSKLYQLSNPGYLGGGGQGDSNVIQFLVDNVFNVNFEKSDPKLKKIGISSGFVYATTVLFPETFLHRNQAQKGLSRKQAEKAFLEIKVSEAERKSFDKEIREAKHLDDTEMESDDKDDWIDTTELLED